MVACAKASEDAAYARLIARANAVSFVFKSILLSEKGFKFMDPAPLILDHLRHDSVTVLLKKELWAVLPLAYIDLVRITHLLNRQMKTGACLCHDGEIAVAGLAKFNLVVRAGLHCLQLIPVSLLRSLDAVGDAVLPDLRAMLDAVLLQGRFISLAVLDNCGNKTI
jgi:hypothetical protein